jgi:ABC-2 type transport system ATP-binding protein
MIEFEAVRRTYGQKVAVAGLDLVVPRGELFAFLGPNGAGKTTTIKMLVGLLRPTSGSVRVCGFDVVQQTREANRRLGYVPDEPYLYDKLSGREFLQFITDMYGLEPRLGRERIANEIETFGLADFVDDLTESYSHGMKQRLVFAAALLHDPQVLVLDEPMVGLDPRSARLVKDLLQERSQQGMTIFMSTHTLGLAEEIADRIGIVDHGQLRCVGTLDELRQSLALEGTSLEQLFLEVTGAAERQPSAK